ncbi:MAG: alanine--tRNA ligase, partial [Rickettsiales bacterium]|nr:alanine--tRNA ligase [Rickettsiales bacterium]
DTGMGLERITSVVQGAHSNYDTDLFLRIISDISEAVGAKPDAGNANSFRVISDHVRAAAFLIADGVTPSNEGRGYVLRRIIRRASRHVSILGMKKPALFKIAASVRDNMGAAYPELSERFGQVSATLRAEEESFASTLDAGLKILEEEAAKIGGGVMPGAAAFRLYDTYGFPLDMTVDILRGMGMSVDEKGFEAEMERQKERSRGAAEFKGEAGTAKVWYDLKARLGETEFIGYDTLASTSKAEAIVVGGEEKQSAPAGAEAWLVFRETPFYAEMGGQVADEGHIETGGAKHRVIDVQKFGGVTAHKVKAAAEIPAGAAAELRVDAAARARTASNHSAAHLLQYALRTVVGEHISQKGSRVWSGGFHFDFSNPRPALLEQIEEMERVANALIDEAATITMMPMPIEEAKKTGAIALFNEKYGDMVRVVKIGGKSVEFCGGTHCRSTAEVKFFHIISERSIAAGIRRIEAVAGDAALEYASSLGLDTSGSALDLCARLRDKLLSDRKRAEADAIAELERKKAEEAAATEREEKAVKAGAELSEINGVKIASFAGAVSSKNLKSIARSITGADVAAIVATTDGKASLVVFAPTGKISAVEAVRAVLSGAGGGNAEIAQGGMPAAQAEDAIANLKKYIQDNI